MLRASDAFLSKRQPDPTAQNTATWNGTTQADDEEVKLALARKEGQARDTWREICTIPDVSRAQAVESSDNDDPSNDDHNNDDADLPPGTRRVNYPHRIQFLRVGKRAGVWP